MKFNINPSLSRFKSLRDITPTATTWEAVVNEIRSDAYAPATTLYRENLKLLDAAAAAVAGSQPASAAYNAAIAQLESLKARKSQIKKDCPAFIIAAEVEGGRTLAHVKRYTGFVMVDLDGIPDDIFAATLQNVRADAHAFLVYTTISGRGIRVVSKVAGVTDKDTFTQAWKAVNQYYATLTGIEIDGQCKNATRMSVICHDPEAQYRLDSAVFSTEELQVAVASSVSRKTPRPSGAISPASVFSAITARLENEGVQYQPGSYNAYVSRCFYWMNRYGVPQGAVAGWAAKQFPDYPQEQLLPVIKSCYALTTEHATARLSADGGSHRRKAGVEEMEAFIHHYMRIRLNVLTHQTEVSVITDDPKRNPQWERLTDQVENSLWCAMQRGGMEVDMFRLHTLLLSDFVPSYHPLLHYLEHLPAWDGTTDYIRQMGEMVHVKDNPPCATALDAQSSSLRLDFPQILCRWLVAMIASAHDDNVVNQIILVLIGRQGCYKTSFMQNLLPPELKAYYTTKSNSNRMTKDDLFTMTEYLIINLEEIDAMNATELNQLKAMVTQRYVDERPAYGRNKVHLPHVASFVATGNNLQFLTDESNRRWLPFEVDRIDSPWANDFPYEGIYAQAYALYKRGYRYWFSEEEIKLLSSHVRKFEIPKAEYELILTYYRKPLEHERGIYITCSQIIARFGNPALKLSIQKIGRSMMELGFKKIRTREANYWHVVERTSEDVQHQLPGEIEGDGLPF